MVAVGGAVEDVIVIDLVGDKSCVGNAFFLLDPRNGSMAPLGRSVHLFVK